MTAGLSGILNLDKPPGLSSAAAVERVKRLLPAGTKIGHAGTLDPFATGVLVLLIGKSTRLAERFMSQPKQYEATVKLGATTPTLDPTAPQTPTAGAAPLPRSAIEAAIQPLIGTIQQLPPAFSALKIAGRPAYKMARRGQPVDLAPRTVVVYGIDILSYDWPFLRLRIDCGRGTYVRAIARDLGELLGVGGYLTELRRTRVGEFRIEDSATLAQLAEQGALSHLRSAPP